jgi:hypothetical protein
MMSKLYWGLLPYPLSGVWSIHNLNLLILKDVQQGEIYVLYTNMNTKFKYNVFEGC